MRTFAQNPEATRQTTPAKSTTPFGAGSGRSREAGTTLHFQHAVGNQPGRRLQQANGGQLDADLVTTPSPRSGHDFGRISVCPEVPPEPRAKLLGDVRPSPGRPPDAVTAAFTGPCPGRDFAGVPVFAGEAARVRQLGVSGKPAFGSLAELDELLIDGDGAGTPAPAR